MIACALSAEQFLPFCVFSNQDDTWPALGGGGGHKCTQAHKGTEFVPAHGCVWENESYRTLTYFWKNLIVNVTLQSFFEWINQLTLCDHVIILRYTDVETCTQSYVLQTYTPNQSVIYY